MSADSHTVCPKCHPDLVGWCSSAYPGNPATDHAAEELGYDRSVRENVEYYLKGGTHLVFSYDASCWDCGWHWGFEHEEPIPGLTADQAWVGAAEAFSELAKKIALGSEDG